MNRDKIIFWSATIIIFVFEGVIPLFTSQTDLGKDGIKHLGYPEYFGIVVLMCNIAGGLALIIPQVPSRIKEWAYAGFIFSLIFATVSHIAVDGIVPMSFLPLLILVILIVSYVYHNKLQTKK